MREQVQLHRKAASHHPELDFQRNPPGTLQLLRYIEADRKQNAENQTPHKHTPNLTVIVLSYVDLVCFVRRSRFSYECQIRVGVVIDIHPCQSTNFLELDDPHFVSLVQDHAEMNAPPVLRPLRAILQRRLVCLPKSNLD